jgi:ParB family transcriptional regulator, chromosome partitioning protein
MSRKIFGPDATEGLDASKTQVDAPAPVTAERRVHSRPLMGLADIGIKKDAQPVGAFGASLSQLNERGKRAEEIERKLATGQTVVELDTALIDPSFVADRMPLSEAALADLVDAIRDNTQLSPILVRPHPDVPGRYQTAFGHRRTRAVAMLGISVRAIVRQMTDEEMVVAQGQENHARKDLSYIEKARFAQRLETRFSRDTIMAAMSVYKSDLSNMLTVAHRIPEDVTDAIGPAPKTGRRGWIQLAEMMRSAKTVEAVRKVSTAPQLQNKDSDDRFNAVLTAIRPGAAKSKTEVWSNARGERLAKVASNAQRVAIVVDRKQSPAFADFLLNKVKDLYAELEQDRAGPSSAET